MNFKEKAQSKVGSKDNIQHKPSGGERKVGVVEISILCGHNIIPTET